MRYASRFCATKRQWCVFDNLTQKMGDYGYATRRGADKNVDKRNAAILKKQYEDKQKDHMIDVEA